MHVGVPIWWWLIFSKPSNPRFRGKVVQKCPIWGHHTQIHDLTALNAGIRWEKKKYLWYHLYHCDHDDRLILASYVVPQINEYFILRNIYFFAPKSLLVCILHTCLVQSLHVVLVLVLVLISLHQVHLMSSALSNIFGRGPCRQWERFTCRHMISMLYYCMWLLSSKRNFCFYCESKSIKINRPFTK